MAAFNYGLSEFQCILRMSQKELKHYLAKHLKSSGYTITSQNGFLYAEGSIPVLLVAHLDTIHQEKPEIICISEDGRYMMSPQGIGGDDRCGVYMILQIIQSAKCHILFCEEEETGANGARVFTQSKIHPDVNYIIEMDRRGNNDAVFYGCANPDFTDFVESFDFIEALGSFSDISVIAPYLKTAAVNISAGYYYEHRLHEFIDLVAMECNIRRITQMVQTAVSHFPYMQRKNSFGQFSLFDSQQSVFDFRENIDTKHKMLMNLPDTARLIINGYEVIPESAYLIDRDSNVYIYLEELNAAVESEHSFACNENGEPISFSPFEAQRLLVLSMDTALEQLSMDFS